MGRTSAVAIERLERNRRALRMRRDFMTWPEIARECGFSDQRTAQTAVSRLIKRETHADIVDYRKVHIDRLEALMRSLWLSAINPGMAQQAARTAQQPAPPSQEKSIELLRRLLDDLAGIEGTKAPVHAELSGPNGGPIEGRLDVMHWAPDDAFMSRYVVVLREAGLLNDPIEGEVRQLGPGEGDPEVEPI